MSQSNSTGGIPDAVWFENHWNKPAQLQALAKVMLQAAADESSVSDDALVVHVEKTLWGTNLDCRIEQCMAIVSSVCALRPRLATRLVHLPLDSYSATGITDLADVLRDGLRIAASERPYVEPTPDGRRWLCLAWPNLEPEIAAEWRKLMADIEPSEEEGIYFNGTWYPSWDAVPKGPTGPDQR